MSQRRTVGRATELLLSSLLPRPARAQQSDETLQELLEDNGFDPELHERIRADLRAGRIGLAQNRLPANAVIEDVGPEDVLSALEGG